MDTPTPDMLRAESDLLAQQFPDPAGDAKLQSRAIATSVVVAVLTFRTIAPITESTVQGYAFEEVPEGLRPIAVRVIALMAAYDQVRGGVDFAEAAASGQLLRSFSAGPYSESYFGPGEMVVKGGLPQMHPDPMIAALLWALATESAREYFRAQVTGVQPAAFGSASPAWGQSAMGRY